MSDHTPEPWKLDPFECRYVFGPNGEMIADWEDDSQHGYVVRMRGWGAQLPQLENVKRIVACVNACAGMGDPVEEIAELRRDNERLMNLLAGVRVSLARAYDGTNIVERRGKEINVQQKEMNDEAD